MPTISSGGDGQIVLGQDTTPFSNSPFAKGSAQTGDYFTSGAGIPKNQWDGVLSWDEVVKNRPVNYTNEQFLQAEAYQQLSKGQPYTRSAGALPAIGQSSAPPLPALPPAGGTSLGVQYEIYADGTISYTEGNVSTTLPPRNSYGEGGLIRNTRAAPTGGAPLLKDPPSTPTPSTGTGSGSLTGSSGGLTYDRRGTSSGSTRPASSTTNAANTATPTGSAAQKRSTNSPVNNASRPSQPKAPAGNTAYRAPETGFSSPPKPINFSPTSAPLARPGSTLYPSSEGLRNLPIPKPGNPVGSNSAGSGPVKAPGAIPPPIAGIGRGVGGAAKGAGANKALGTMANNMARGVTPGMAITGVGAAIQAGSLMAAGYNPGEALGITGLSTGFGLAGSYAGGAAGVALGGLTGPLAPITVPILGTAGSIFGGTIGGIAGQMLGQAIFGPPPPLPAATGEWIPPGALPPFTGGQSPGVRYRGYVQYKEHHATFFPNGQDTDGYEWEFTGPIGGLILGAPRAEGGYRSIAIKHAGGTTTLHSFPSSAWVTSASIKNLRRADGQPDTSGDPPPVAEPAPSPSYSPLQLSPTAPTAPISPTTALGALGAAGAVAPLLSAINPPWQAPGPAPQPITTPDQRSGPGKGPEFADPTTAPAPDFKLPTFAPPGVGPGVGTSGGAATGTSGASKQGKATGPQPLTRRAVGDLPASVGGKLPSTGTPVQPASWAPPKTITFPGTFTPFPPPETAPALPERAPDGQPRTTTTPPAPVVQSPSPRDPFGNTQPNNPTITSTNNPNAPQTTTNTNTDPGINPGTGPGTAGDICNQPCIQSLGQKADQAELDLAEILRLLRAIYKTLGVDSFPLSHPLLTGESAGGQKDLVELIEWTVKNIDATDGHWPLDVKVLGADGKDRTITVKDQSEAIHELFGLLFTIAEDADAAVNIGARNVVETIQTKISTMQSGQLLKAIIKFLGFNTRTTKDKVKISVSPSAAGADNKLQNQEMADFLKPSEQLFSGTEYQDSKQLLIMLERILEDSEIARAALYKPLKKNKKGQDTLTGEAIRREKLSGTDIYEQEWEAFIASLKKRDVEIDEKKPGSSNE